MKKKKGLTTLLIILALLIVIGAGVIFFGFVYDPSAIGIRHYLAQKMVEKGDDNKAENLYYDILSRDETDAESYLALGGIYIRAEEYDDAHEILEEGLKYAPCQDIADKQWYVYELEADLVAEGGAGKELLDFVNDIPAQELRKHFDDQSAADKYAGDDAKRWTDSILALAKRNLDHGDAAGAQIILEDALDQPLNDLVDIQALNDMLITVYLKQGNDALAANDKDHNAKYFFDRVLALDSENEEALAGLEKLSAMEEEARKWKNVDISAVVKSDLKLDVHGLKLSVPITVICNAIYDGKTEGSESLNIDEEVTLSMLGQKQQQKESIKIYQDRKDLVVESRLTGSQREKDTSLKEMFFGLIDDYHTLISSASSEGEQNIKGIMCNVSHSTVKGKDYLYYIPKDVMPDGLEAILKSLTLDVTRYTAVDDGRVVRVEAEMLTVDSDAMNELIKPYLGSSITDVTMESLTVIIDVVAK